MNIQSEVSLSRTQSIPLPTGEAEKVKQDNEDCDKWTHFGKEIISSLGRK